MVTTKNSGETSLTAGLFHTLELFREIPAGPGSGAARRTIVGRAITRLSGSQRGPDSHLSQQMRGRGTGSAAKSRNRDELEDELQRI